LWNNFIVNFEALLRMNTDGRKESEIKASEINKNLPAIEAKKSNMHQSV
jgi:hypothetical protein